MKREKETHNRILELADALERGRQQYERIMEALARDSGAAPEEGSRKIPAQCGGETFTEDCGKAQEAGNRDWPVFAVDEVYDLHPGKNLRIQPPGSGEIQLQFTAASDEEQDSDPTQVCSRIAAGDNLEYMVWLLGQRRMAGKLQLIYVDPPFFTGAKYQASVQITGQDGSKSPLMKVGAYEDKWGHDLGAYLEMLAVRFYVMRELLSETGCLWVHLDWHGSHYVKMMLDEIFGSEQFINEVAWTYKSGGASKRSFARKHDTLLFYSKTKEYKFHPLREKSYNREGKPYRFRGVKEYQDEKGWYTLVNMKDVWNIDMVGRTSSERMGYATQKPEKLLERIVEACTDPWDLCADFFAGTGTLGAVCSRKGRPWIMCDEGDAAIGSQILRMSKQEQPFLVERAVKPYEIRPRASVTPAVRGGMLLLERYQPDLTQVREQDREIVAGYINANSPDLVSFWSVDQSGDGREQGGYHLARQLLSGTETAGETAGRRISIVGYDIFGSRFSWNGEAAELEEAARSNGERRND